MTSKFPQRPPENSKLPHRALLAAIKANDKEAIRKLIPPAPPPRKGPSKAD